MKESQAAALRQGDVHDEGMASEDVELALPFCLVGRQGHQDLYGHRRPAHPRRASRLFKIWVCADGVWVDDTRISCPAT